MRDSPLIRRIREGIIGDDHVLEGPFGPRRITYADYTASGRAVTFVEDFIRDEVLPWYANTHTEASRTGEQTTRFREDARAIIKEAAAGDETTVVIFTGAGATGAIDTMLGLLGLRVPSPPAERHRLAEAIPKAERPVVFIGPFEHHSNELPWRESIADVVVIGEDPDGRMSLSELEAMLERYRDRPLKVGSFSAASNVTGIMTDTRAVAELLHRHGALSFWDFAAAGPHLDIEMCDKSGRRPGGYKDAVFLSPHKFVGGPGAAGVLLVRRELLENRVPTTPGGGTVDYVGPSGEVDYLVDPAHRQEGGTPAILGSIRAGMVVALRQAVGTDAVRTRERGFLERALASWKDRPEIEVLGGASSERLAIVSFLIRTPTGRCLHHNFVVALLNDLFGIQARGGCSCAGPYGHRLLGIDPSHSHRFREQIRAGHQGIKPGWTRIGFDYFLSEPVFAYLVEAVRLIAAHGRRLIPEYEFDLMTGLWRHRRAPAPPPRRLTPMSFVPAETTGSPRRHLRAPESALRAHLDEARRILTVQRDGMSPDEGEPPSLPADCEGLRWFDLSA